MTDVASPSDGDLPLPGSGYNVVMSQPGAIFTTAGIRALEARYLPQTPLMERAGAAVAESAAAMLGRRPGRPLVVCGPGNNGGDGFVAARLLRQRGFDPAAVFRGDVAKLPADARAAHDAWLAAGGEVLADIPTGPFALAVDALFGIGLARPVEGRYAEVIDRINGLCCPVLAVDIPSGLHSDTGQVMGRAVGAARTVTFIAAKPGLLTLDGPDRCGELEIADLGVDAGAAEGRLIASDLFAQQLRPRRRNSHKGSYGNAV